MYRVYIGNLHDRVTDVVLLNIFKEQGLTVSSILVKKGYGFVDCPDQATFDMTIDRLNGYNVMGSSMQVEPSTVSKRRRCNRILIRNLPQSIEKEEIEHLVASFGKVDRCDLVIGSLETSVIAVYENSDEAHLAVEKLNNYDCNGSVLRAEFMNSSSVRPMRGSEVGVCETGRVDLPGRTVVESAHYMLRMLIPSEYVGVIIGRKGQTIRHITTESRAARIDIIGREQPGSCEKTATIMGSPESVSLACSMIMKTMQQEASLSERSGVILKILTSDSCCGRVIGREGRVIRRIRDQTSTRITISSPQDTSVMYPDRVISVEGGVENICRAEVLISRLIRDSQQFSSQQPQYSSQMQGDAAAATTVMSTFSHPIIPPLVQELGGVPHMSPFARSSHIPIPLCVPSLPVLHLPYSVATAAAKATASLFLDPILRLPVTPPHAESNETYYVHVPDCVVGALIGIAGRNIRQMIRDSGAQIQVEQKGSDDSDEQLIGVGSAAERVVTVRGRAEACYMAIYYIYERIKLEGFCSSENTQLRIGTPVPRAQVGQIIGKSGRNVRNLQEATGASLKVLTACDTNSLKILTSCDTADGCNTRGDCFVMSNGTASACDVGKIENSVDVVGDHVTHADIENGSSSGDSKGKETGGLAASQLERSCGEIEQKNENRINGKEGHAVLEVYGNFLSTQHVFAHVRMMLQNRR